MKNGPTENMADAFNADLPDPKLGQTKTM